MDRPTLGSAGRARDAVGQSLGTRGYAAPVNRTGRGRCRQAFTWHLLEGGRQCREEFRERPRTMPMKVCTRSSSLSISQARPTVVGSMPVTGRKTASLRW